MSGEFPWVEIAAYEDWHPGVEPGKVLVCATMCGARSIEAPRRKFLIDATEYRAAPKPFVVDPDIHQEA